MEEITLEVHVRKELGSRKVKRVYAEDRVPAIVYGGDREPTPIKVDRRAYEKVMRQHKGQSVLFHLNVLENGRKVRDYSALLKEEQHHPVTDALIHIDFQRVSLKEEIEAKVPLVAKGEAVGVKRDKGALDQTLRELDVVCLPMAIPEKIEVDVGRLEIGDSLAVKDVILPAGVRTRHDPDAVVFSVVPPIKEETGETEEGPEEPEVIKEKKDKAKE